MTPESLSREGSPIPDACPDSTISSPVIHGTHLEVKTSQSAPGSPGHPGKNGLCHHIYCAPATQVNKEHRCSCS
jgi:hypothetical protein